MYDLIVVGGGPAGMTATIYAIRKRLNVLMVTKDLGGYTNYHLELPWIEDYQVIRGLEVVDKFRTELEYLGYAHKFQAVERIEKTAEGFIVRTESDEALEAKAVIFAPGCRKARLYAPGEKEFMMKGLCYSTLSYAPLFIDREVVVVGDGDLAQRSAAELATCASKVTIISLSNDCLDTPLCNKLKADPKVNFLYNNQVVEIKGDKYARSMIIKGANGERKEVAADGFFVEIGMIPNFQPVAGLVEQDEKGRVKIDCSNRTSVPGLFAAGDVTTSPAEQVLIAIGEGAKAALNAYEYLLPTL